MHTNGLVAKIYFAMNGGDKKAERKLFRYIANTFGGWTLYYANGGYISNSKQLIVEESHILEILAFGTENTKRFESKIRKLAGKIRRIYNQESVAVSISEVKGYFLYE
jgi:hypothetical protein